MRRIRSLGDLSTLERTTPIVTLFSGGLDSTYLLSRLAESGFSDVTALLVDIGEDHDLDRLTSCVNGLGASMVVKDLRSVFAEDYVLPSIAAQPSYLNTHPVSSTLSRPLLAAAAHDLAGQLGSRVILHTANRSQNTLRRLNGALEGLGFDGLFGSPYELTPVDRSTKLRRLEEGGSWVMGSRPFSLDINLWCREFESGALDDPERFAVPSSLYEWTTGDASSSEECTVAFERGRPATVNGCRLSAQQLIADLNARVGRHGLGRYEGLEHLPSGNKVLEVREMPGAHLLVNAYRVLESASVGAEEIREKLHVEQLWVREGIEGRWFGALHRACSAFISSIADSVSGEVTYELGNRRMTLASVRADEPRYLTNREHQEGKEIAEILESARRATLPL